SLAAPLRLAALHRAVVLYWVLDEYDDVMDDASVAGPDFSGLHPLVFAEVRRHSDVHVGYDPVGRDLDFFGHLDNRIGLADGPTLDELRNSGQISGVAFRSSLINP